MNAKNITDIDVLVPSTVSATGAGYNTTFYEMRNFIGGGELICTQNMSASGDTTVYTLFQSSDTTGTAKAAVANHDTLTLTGDASGTLTIDEALVQVAPTLPFLGVRTVSSATGGAVAVILARYNPRRTGSN